MKVVDKDKQRRVRIGTMIMIALLNVMFMIAFVWHAELYMVTLVVDSLTEFTNGFWNSEPVKVYHVWMVLMFIMGASASYHLIRLAVKKE